MHCICIRMPYLKTSRSRDFSIYFDASQTHNSMFFYSCVVRKEVPTWAKINFGVHVASDFNPKKPSSQLNLPPLRNRGGWLFAFVWWALGWLFINFCPPPRIWPEMHACTSALRSTGRRRVRKSHVRSCSQQFHEPTPPPWPAIKITLNQNKLLLNHVSRFCWNGAFLFCCRFCVLVASEQRPKWWLHCTRGAL